MTRPSAATPLRCNIARPMAARCVRHPVTFTCDVGFPALRSEAQFSCVQFLPSLHAGLHLRPRLFPPHGRGFFLPSASLGGVKPNTQENPSCTRPIFRRMRQKRPVKSTNMGGKPLCCRPGDEIARVTSRTAQLLRFQAVMRSAGLKGVCRSARQEAPNCCCSIPRAVAWSPLPDRQ
jgi:hypothetical protein